MALSANEAVPVNEPLNDPLLNDPLSCKNELDKADIELLNDDVAKFKEAVAA